MAKAALAVLHPSAGTYFDFLIHYKHEFIILEPLMKAKFCSLHLLVFISPHMNHSGCQGNVLTPSFPFFPAAETKSPNKRVCPLVSVKNALPSALLLGQLSHFGRKMRVNITNVN